MARGDFRVDPHTVTSWLLLSVLLWVGVSLSRAHNMSSPVFRWDSLEALATRINPLYEKCISREEYHAHYLWNLYNSSTRLERPKILNEISESLKQISYRDTRLDIIGSILFGPEKGREILRRRDQDGYLKLHEGEVYSQCLIVTDKLLRKHCGPLTHNGMRHTRSLSNLCHYVEELAKIEDAIIATCGLNNVAPSAIDLGNPKIVVYPKPIHGTSQYCERVVINGISRTKFQSYGKAYQVIFKPFPSDLQYKVRICLHRNASRGLCQCEKGEWVSIRKWSRDSFMSPYELRFVDVKLTSAMYGGVTIILNEVPHLLRYGMLAGGVCLLFMAGIN